MALFGKDYTADFEKLRKEIRLVRENINDANNTNFDKVFVAMNEIQKKQESLEDSIEELVTETKTLRAIIFNSVEPAEMVDVEVPDPENLIRDVPNSCKVGYSKMFMDNDFTFASKNRPDKALFDIVDVLHLSEVIEDTSTYPTLSSLHQAVLPDYSRNSFLKMVYNYEKGFFNQYLEDYFESFTFGRDEFELLINGVHTGLDVKEVMEIVDILINTNDFKKSVIGLTHSYPHVKPVFIKLVAEHWNDPELAAVIPSLAENIEFENNPQKRKEKAL